MPLSLRALKILQLMVVHCLLDPRKGAASLQPQSLRSPAGVVLPATTTPKLFGGRGYGGASHLTTQQ